jgi:hypothetical protein
MLSPIWVFAATPSVLASLAIPKSPSCMPDGSMSVIVVCMPHGCLLQHYVNIAWNTMVDTVDWHTLIQSLSPTNMLAAFISRCRILLVCSTYKPRQTSACMYTDMIRRQRHSAQCFLHGWRSQPAASYSCQQDNINTVVMQEAYLTPVRYFQIKSSGKACRRGQEHMELLGNPCPSGSNISLREYS